VLRVVAQDDGVLVALGGRPVEREVDSAHVQRREGGARLHAPHHLVCSQQSSGVNTRVGYRLDVYDTGAKTILLNRYRFLNGARTDTFFKIKSKQQRFFIYCKGKTIEQYINS